MSSELPTIDPLKVAQKEIAKLEAEVRASRNRESQLETLAEALRDERDEYKSLRDEISAERDALKAEVEALKDTPTVAKITEL